MKLRLVNPFFLILSLLMVDVFIHLLIPDIYGKISTLTIYVVVLYICSFFVGFYILCGVFPKLRSCRKKAIRLKVRPWILLVFFGLGFSYYAYSFFSAANFNFAQYRQFVFAAYSEKNTAYWLIRLFSLYAFIASFYLLLIKGERKINIIFFFLVVIISIVSTGRNYLVIYFLFLFIFVLNSRRPAINILISIFMFFTISGFFVFAFNKSSGALVSGTIGSVLHYFAMPLHGLSVMLSSDEYYGSIMLLSPGLLDFLGIDYNPVPVMPYTPRPYVTNVYTLFYPIYYDLGLLGIAIFGVIYGFAHGVIYYYAKRGGAFALYVYGISLYPLVMTLFTDVYLSSIGLWVAALIPWVLVESKPNLNPNQRPLSRIDGLGF